MRRTFLVSGAVVAVCLLAVPAGAQSDTQRKVIELAQKEAVKQLKAKLPQKIDEATTLIDVASSGVILAYTFSIDTTTRKPMPNFIELVQKNATATVCKTDGMVKAMKVGAVYRYIYVDAQAKPLGQFDVKSTDCA